MNISDFCKFARNNDLAITVIADTQGYCVLHQLNERAEPTRITHVNDHTRIRYWKSLDRCVKNLQEQGYQGTLSLAITQQINLLQ